MTTDNKKTTIIIYSKKPHEKENAIGAIQDLTILNKDPASLEEESTPIKLQATRIRFDRLRIAEIFSRGYLHVNSQIYPLQIAKLTDGDVDCQVQNAWITSMGYSCQTDDWVIVENMEMEAESVDDKK